MASQLELAQDSLEVRRTQLTRSTRRLAARGEPDQLLARRFILILFSHYFPNRNTCKRFSHVKSN
jgi:hypothetical protein